MVDLLSGTEEYKEFQEFDMNKKYPLKNKIKQREIYTQENVDKFFISIDMSSANFNALKVKIFN
jgi:hypothetical protein